jgi:transcriptional regulator GlxA family with amidase domain
MKQMSQTIQVSLVLIPEVTASTTISLYDVFNLTHVVAEGSVRFQIRLVGESSGPVMTMSGITLHAETSYAQVPRTDIVILPSVMLPNEQWPAERHVQLAQWLRQQYQQGAILCSACTGVFPLLQTGLFDQATVTCHWAYANNLRRAYPAAKLCIDKTLIVTGPDNRLVMSGASGSWHDLALYLIERFSGPVTASAVAKFFLLNRHPEGQAAYATFQEDTGHGDAAIARVQAWLSEHWRDGVPVEQLARQADMTERSFKRRFKSATGHTPVDYVQHLRIERAKQHLENSMYPVDEIAAKVGYEEPAFFRKLFKRITGLTPRAYRRKFQIPASVYLQDPMAG